jgi:predicted TIM-barrel fold metal-dependent hydrolase
MNAITSKPISADSHVVEPGRCYIDNIEAKYRDRAPRLEPGPKGGDYLVIDGYTIPMPFSKMAAAGMDLVNLPYDTMKLEDTHLSAFDPKYRIADQERDGVGAEILYPTVGMLVCAVDDADYKQACNWAYNRWLAEYVSYAPDRLFGLGQTAVRSVPEAIEDFRKFKEMGFKGVMLPSEPSTEVNYHDKSFDPLWRAASELKLPLSFHLATSKASVRIGKAMNSVEVKPMSQPPANAQHDVLRANQDLIGTFIWGGVFERHPDLKIVCVEADASWAPHLMGRMDYYYHDRKDKKYDFGLSKAPSEYFMHNVYFTIQNDWLALRMLDFLNPKRLLWANDFPHSDGPWPRSQELLQKHAAHLTPAQRSAILHDNVAELYGLN